MSTAWTSGSTSLVDMGSTPGMKYIFAPSYFKEARGIAMASFLSLILEKGFLTN